MKVHTYWHPNAEQSAPLSTRRPQSPRWHRAVLACLRLFIMGAATLLCCACRNVQTLDDRLKQWPETAFMTEAAQFVADLGAQGHLPGLPKPLKPHSANITSTMQVTPEATTTYPLTQTMCLTITGETEKYYYTVVRASKGGDLHLQKAWKADPEGRVVQEYKVE